MLLDTPLCDFGWPAPDFTLNDPAGQSYSKAQLMGANGLLVAFICNHCPYVIAIAGRLAVDARALAEGGINTVAIMANDYHAYPADSPQNMTRFAEEYNFDFPYLVDEDQNIARAYGAVSTPDFFGLNSKGQLQYRGRLDDAGMRAADQRRPELLSAMQLIARTGQGPKEQIASMGCSIKWK